MRRHHPGFTLIELLVALFITAIMFAIGYRALTQAFKSRAEVDERTARLTALQQAMRTIEQDFELMQPRPVRNLIGDGYLPAIMTFSSGTGIGNTSSASSNPFGSSSSTPFGSTSGSTPGSSSGGGGSSSGGSNSTSIPVVTFTRGGWTNPVGVPRSELQRVSYVVENGALMREYTGELDATPNDPIAKRQLIDHVKYFNLRFMDAGHQWRTEWPPSTLGAGPQGFVLRSRPVAVEVTIELEDWGVLVRHIEVAG